MVKAIKRKIPFYSLLKKDEGMTLVEVSIAVLLFSVFVVAFISGQGNNVFDSVRLKDEMILKDLVEYKLNEIMINPPEFKETLATAAPEVKDFEDFPGYRYTLIMKKIFIPDYTKLVGKEDEDQTDETQKKIFKTFKENMEKLVWQISIKVESKESGDFSELSTWIYNGGAKVAINPF